jgi:hypothetical protein
MEKAMTKEEIKQKIEELSETFSKITESIKLIEKENVICPVFYADDANCLTCDRNTQCLMDAQESEYKKCYGYYGTEGYDCCICKDGSECHECTFKETMFEEMLDRIGDKKKVIKTCFGHYYGYNFLQCPDISCNVRSECREFCNRYKMGE